MVEHTASAFSSAARPKIVQALRVVAPLVVLSILAQTFFAGRGLFVNTDNIDIHGGIANLTVLLVIAQAGCALMAGLRGPARAAVLTASLALVALVLVQLGLGYNGRDGGQIAAWHVLNGVLIFGIAVGNAVLVALLHRNDG